MPHSVAKRRRFAVLAVLAVVASLLVVPVSPAGATAGTADKKATFSACPTGVAPAAGFTDVGASSFAAAAIDCVKYYGVTQGTSATTYSPGSPVTREQMALFLIRAAGPAGITVPAASSQGFTDIATLSQASQDAINQLKALGITTGTSATTYSPADTVSRVNMAQFLARFLNLAIQGPGGGGKPNSFAGDDSQFTDLGAVSVDGFNAVYDLFELGVTTGTSATTFSPFDAVTREQMAAFIARTLNHTNARPKGVNIQAVPSAIIDGDDVAVAITVRDDTFKPVANALVDVFEAALADKAAAVKADGTCDTSKTSATYGGTECAVDVSDVDTDANGNITDTVSPSASVIWWAWRGATGATFDKDTVQVSAAEVTVSPAASDWLITDNVSDDAYDHYSSYNSASDGTAVKFGTTVTVTYQLVDSDGDPVALAGENVTIEVDRYVNGVYLGTTVTTYSSDATGKVTVSWTEADSNTGTWVGSTATDNVTEIFWDLSGTTLGYIDETDNAHWSYEFDDDPAEAYNASLSTSAAYTTGTSVNATAKVVDQYGIGIGGESVDFYADAVFLATRTTNSSGNATQTITGASGADGDDVLVLADTDTDDPTKTVYFTLEAPDNTAAGPWGIVAVDTANDSIVVTDGVAAFWLLTWDANDQFTTTAPTTQTAFETALDAGGAANDEVTFVYRTADTNVSSFDLS
jgi:hypothetical protein